MHFCRGLKALLSSSGATVLKRCQIAAPRSPWGRHLLNSRRTALHYVLLIRVLESMYFCGVSGMYQCQVCYAMLQNRLFLHCSLLFSFSVFVAAQIWGKSWTAAISKTGWKRVLKETLKWWRNPICWPRRHILRARMAGYVLQVSFHPPQQCVRYDWLLKCLPGNCCSHLGPNTVILKLP